MGAGMHRVYTASTHPSAALEYAGSARAGAVQYDGTAASYSNPVSLYTVKLPEEADTHVMDTQYGSGPTLAFLSATGHPKTEE